MAPAHLAKRTLPLTLTALVAALVALPALAQSPDTVRVVSDASGERLQVNGRDTMVFGMNWDYFPIGTNYSYDFWGQPDEFIRGRSPARCL